MREKVGRPGRKWEANMHVQNAKYTKTKERWNIGGRSTDNNF
jgi:hypothetical protein